MNGRRVRILAVSHLFPNANERRYGIFVARQLSAMAEAGAEIVVLVPRVYCPTIMRSLRKYANYGHHVSLCQFAGLSSHAVPYLRLPGSWFKRWSGLVVYLATKRLAARLHRQKPFDIIYATDLFPDGDAALRLGKHLRIPATCLAIGSDVNVAAASTERMQRHFTRVVQGLDGLLACGQSIADRIDRERTDKTLCVYGVVDLDRYSTISDSSGVRDKLQLPRDKKIVCYVGYFWIRKGLLELIRAFEITLAHVPDALLLLCGQGEAEEELRSAAVASQAVHEIRFGGAIDPDEVHEYLQASDLFVLPSHSEGMPNVVMEAMACGKPVVCTAVGGLPAAVGECEGVWLVPPKDPDRLAAALIEALSVHNARNDLGKHVRARAEQDFGVAPNATKILDFLRTIRDRATPGAKSTELANSGGNSE